MQSSHTPQAVLGFWRDAGPKRWFKKNEAFDIAFREAFLDAHLAAARRQLNPWMDSAEGALGLLLLLDQYPRNAFRDTPHMFATDPLARDYARQMVAQGLDRQVDAALRAFCYLPFGHSEEMPDQQLSVQLSESLDAGTLRFARMRADIIERFGRFPHRNALLGRQTTEGEQQFLISGGFTG